MRRNDETEINCFKCGENIKSDNHLARRKKTKCPNCGTKNDVVAGMRNVKRKPVRIDIIAQNIIYGFLSGITIILLLFSLQL